MDWSSEIDILIKIGKATKDNKGSDKTGNYKTAEGNPSNLVRRSLDLSRHLMATNLNDRKNFAAVFFFLTTFFSKVIPITLLP